MKDLSKTLGYAGVVIVVVVAILLIGLIFGWVSTDDAQDTIMKVLGATAVVVAAVLAIAGINSLLNKD